MGKLLYGWGLLLTPGRGLGAGGRWRSPREAGQGGPGGLERHQDTAGARLDEVDPV